MIYVILRFFMFVDNGWRKEFGDVFGVEDVYDLFVFLVFFMIFLCGY